MTPTQQLLLEENAGLRRQLERSLQHERELTEQLTATQKRCTELLELNRALDQRARVREFMDRSAQDRRVSVGLVPAPLFFFRVSLVAEEFCEMLEASGVDAIDTRYALERDIHSAKLRSLQTSAYPEDVDLVELVDAFADIDYVVEGFRQTLGVDSAPIAAEVHRSNWEKVCNGIKKHPETGKVMKPDGWKPPQIEAELVKQGWMKP